MEKPIAEMTEDELYERINALYKRRAELIKEMKSIDDEAYQIEYKLMGGIQYTRPILLRAPQANACGENFHYTTLSAICQAKSCRQFAQTFFPKFVHSASCILGGVWYTNNVDREWRLSHRKKIKKKLLTNKKMYVIIIIERKERGFQKAKGQKNKKKVEKPLDKLSNKCYNNNVNKTTQQRKDW